MASLVPISTYNLALKPFNPVPALDDEFPVTVRLTMAAVDLESVDDKQEPSTVRILKRSRAFIDDDEDDLEDLEAEEADELDSEEEAEVEAEKSAKKGKKQQKKADAESESESESGSDDDEDDSDIEDDQEIEEFVLCTLSPKVQFQQALDFTISPGEEVHFVVTGSYPIHLSGNYVEHPADEEDDEYDEDYDSDELDDEYYQDAGEEVDGDNLTPDEDELMNLEELENESDIEGKIEELVAQDEKKKNNKKRAAEEEDEQETPAQAKKAAKKAAKEDKKKVQFTKELEQGPTPSKKDTKAKKDESKSEPKAEKAKKEETKEKKFKTSTLLGGVVTEDRKTGSGALAKSGNKVGIRYIGKLKNGKVFDKNTSGKPFVFNLGKGECIKGFDLGVAGMAVGGERRVIIPAKMGYGSQALPGIPANSELTFDIKLVSLK